MEVILLQLNIFVLIANLLKGKQLLKLVQCTYESLALIDMVSLSRCV